MAVGNTHNHRNCPLILLGRGGGVVEGGMHIKAAKDTPMANVMLTLLHRLGLEDLQSFGDSTGEFSFTRARDDGGVKPARLASESAQAQSQENRDV